MTPALGAGLIVMVLLAVAEPHALVTVYCMVSIPAVIPLTSPPTTVALALVALHTPPGAPLVSVIVAPSHTLLAPKIVPAVRNAPIFTVLVATAVPQALVTVYTTVSSPVDTPDNNPPDVIVARALVTLQAPPGVALVYSDEVPAHKRAVPDMAATPEGTTVTVANATAVPQLLVTE